MVTLSLNVSILGESDGWTALDFLISQLALFTINKEMFITGQKAALVTRSPSSQHRPGLALSEVRKAWSHASSLDSAGSVLAPETRKVNLRPGPTHSGQWDQPGACLRSERHHLQVLAHPQLPPGPTQTQAIPKTCLRPQTSSIYNSPQ